MEQLSNVSTEGTGRQENAPWEIDDVASYLGVSVATVRNHIKDRGLPFRRVGRKQLFWRDEIVAWINSQPGQAA